MSSILDALKKLESEKAEAPVQDDLVLDGASAERELIGDGLLRTGATVRLSPGTLIGLVFAGILLIAGMAGGAVYWATRGGTDGAVKAGIASAPVSQPIVPAMQQVASVPAPAAPVAPVAPTPASVVAVQQQPVPVQVAAVQPQATPSPQPAAPIPAEPPVTPVPVPTPSAQPVQVAAPQPASVPQTPAPAVAPQPVSPAVPAVVEQPPTVVAQAQPVTVGASVEPAASQVDTSAKPKEKRLAKAATTKGDIVAVASSKSPVVTEASVDGSPDSYGAKMGQGAVPAKASVASTQKGGGDDVDVSSLPTLKESDKARLGISDLHINMLRPASKNTPYASAVINFRQVFVGDEIPKTRARLLGIDAGGKGVAIEITGTGERFYVRF